MNLDIVQIIANKIKETDLDTTLDIRITYSIKGVKSNIRYCFNSTNQSKPLVSLECA